MGQIEKDTFVCLDCEMTGLDENQDRIIEVAVVKFDATRTYEQYESLINPERDIPEESIVFHHITADMVVGKPTIKEVLPELIRIIGNHIVVGHGVGFDLRLLDLAGERCGIPCSLQRNRILDTLRMARLYGESPTNSLEQLRKHFNIDNEGAHRAMSDVIVNMEVFKYLSQRYKTTEKLLETLEKPIMMKNMPLGPHKGRALKEIPLQYLQWAVHKDFDQDLLFSLRTEIKRRKKGNLFTQAGNPFSEL